MENLKLTKSWFAVTSLIFILGCNENAELPPVSAPKSPIPEMPGPRAQAELIQEKLSVDRPTAQELMSEPNEVERSLIAFRRLCQNANGQWDATRLECDCGYSKSFVANIHQGDFYGRCEEAQWKPESSAFRLAYHYLEVDELPTHQERLNYDPRGPQDPAPTRFAPLDLLRVFNSDFAPKLSAFLSTRDGIDLTTRIHVGQGPVEEKSMLFGNPSNYFAQLAFLKLEKYPEFLVGWNDTRHYEFHLLEPNPDYLPYALGAQAAETAPEDFFEMPKPEEIAEREPEFVKANRPKWLKSFPSSLEQPILSLAEDYAVETRTDEWMNLFAEIYQGYQAYRSRGLSAEFKPDQVMTNHILGCAYQCELQMKIGEKPGFKYLYVKRYTQGGVEFSAIRILNTIHNRTDAIVLLNWGGSPSLILANTWYRSTRTGQTFFHGQGLDRNFLSRNFTGGKPVNLKIHEAIAATLRTQSRSTPRSLGLVCDGAAAIDGKDPYRWTGPYFPKESKAETTGSLSGLLENPSGSMSSYLSGHWVFEPDTGNPAWREESHTQSVLKAYRSQTRAGPEAESYAVLDARECLDEYENWQPTARAAGMRVGVLTTGMLKDTFMCRQQYEERIFRDPQADFMWIIAGGNATESKIVEEVCPNSLVDDLDGSPFDPLVVAATQANGQLAFGNNSSAGLSYADIAASGDLNGSFGTSFAAPRVAAIAARISSEFPEFKAPIIRSALIFGAAVPEDRELLVKSGGVVSEEGAKSILRELKKVNQPDSKLSVEEQGYLMQHLERGRIPIKIAEFFYSSTLCGDKNLNPAQLVSCPKKTAKIKALRRSGLLIEG